MIWTWWLGSRVAVSGRPHDARWTHNVQVAGIKGGPDEHGRSVHQKELDAADPAV